MHTKSKKTPRTNKKNRGQSTGGGQNKSQQLNRAEGFKKSENTQKAEHKFGGRNDALAIIGIGCMFPEAPKASDFWGNIKSGRDSIQTIPATHWRPDDYHSSDPSSPDKTYASTGGFLTPYEFNPLEYGISPNAIEATDTTQLLGMVVAQQALIDAGYGPDKEFDRDRVSCVIGVTGTLELVIPLGARLGHPIWKKALEDSGVDPEVSKEVVERISESYVGWQENSFPGLLGNVVAGRIANNLNLGGTNCVVDAACASSLSALHLACMELQTGKSDMVITGGFDTFNDIFMYMCFSKTPALSPTGHSKPFDKNADGTILGEGLGTVIIKRLTDAERDGDRIYAVVRGIGSSSDGKGQAIYAPSAKGQCKALKAAYAQTGIDPSTIGLVEAHGTGTKVGDAVEIDALRAVFEQSSPAKNWCALGSVKSQIGHTKAAAGAAGLIKAALALHHKIIPPTIKVSTPTTAMVDSPFYINSEAKPWVASPDHPRRAAVSALGFGGSNFHCVLEEYETESFLADWDGKVQIIAMSDNNFNSLRSRLQDAKLADKPWSEVRDFAAESRISFRKTDSYRLVMAIDGPKGLGSKLGTVDSMFSRASMVGSWSTPDGSYFSSGEVKEQKLAFMFPGQGAQRIDMLKDLACVFPEMNQALSKADKIAAREGRGRGVAGSKGDSADSEWAISPIIYPPKSFSNERTIENKQNLQNTAVAQPAIGAISLGCMKVLERFGIRPDMTAGHSYGELTALHAAGCYSEDVFLTMSFLRGKLMNEASGDDAGTMLAVQGSKPDVEKAILEANLELVVANHNAPNQVVVSGANSEIDKAKSAFRSLRLRSIQLPVGAAFHSPIVSSAEKPFFDFTSKVKIKSPKISVYSNQVAAKFPNSPSKIAKMLSTHLVSPVSFVDEVKEMSKAGASVFIEVGPGNILTGLVNKILGETATATNTVKALSFDQSQNSSHGLLSVARILADLAAMGYPVDLMAWDSEHVLAPVAKKKGFTVTLTGANYVKEKKERAPTRRNQSSRPSETAVSSPASAPTPTPTPASAPAPAPAPAMTFVPAGTSVPPTSGGNLDEGTRRIFSDSRNSSSNSSTAGLQSRGGRGSEGRERQVRTSSQSLNALSNKTRATLFSAARSSVEVHGMSGSQTTSREQPSVHQVSARRYQSISPNTEKKVVGMSNDKQMKNSGDLMQGASASSAFTMTQKSLLSLQELQKQNADLHRKFLEGQQASQEMFHQIMRRQLDLMAGLPTRSMAHPLEQGSENRNFEAPLAQQGGDSTLATSSSLSAESSNTESERAINSQIRDSSNPVSVASEVGQRKQPNSFHPISSPSTVPTEETRSDDTHTQTTQSFSGTVSSSENIDSSSSVASQKQTEQISTPKQAQVGGSSVDVVETLRGIVADKTGYPKEMLEMEMSLEGDLGIDSIKRVEIFSTLQESLGDVDLQTEALASFVTLGDIAEYLSAPSIGADVNGNTEENEVVGSFASTTKMSGEDYRSFSNNLMIVIAEKTGYPLEMLAPDMELEADLGIDSIKKVEIFSALQEKIPTSVAASPDRLNSLRSVSEIIDFFAEGAGGIAMPLTSNSIVSHGRDVAAASATATDNKTVATPPSRQSANGSSTIIADHSNADVKTALFAVIADKTGYPVEMLSLEMDLEGDLGIDSIKRVEIFSSLQEKAPVTANTDPEILSGFRSINDVVLHYQLVDGGVSSGSDLNYAEAQSVIKAVIPSNLASEKKNKKTHGSIDRFLVKSVPFLSDDAQQPLKFPAVSTVWVAGCSEPQSRPFLEAFSRKNIRAVFVDMMNLEELEVPNALAGVIILTPSEKLPVNESKFLLNVFELSQTAFPALQDASVDQDGFYVTVTFNGGYFGLSGLGSGSNPYFAGVSGFSKTLSHEWPEINCKSVDLEICPDMTRIADGLIDQCLKRGAIEVGVTSSCLTTVVVDRSDPIQEDEHPLNKEDVIVITGGARGVTAEVVVELARRFKSTMILLGRSPLPDPEPHWLIGVKKEADIKKAIIQNVNSNQGGNQKLTLKEVEAKFRQIMSWRAMEAVFDRIREIGVRFVYRSVDVRDQKAVKILLGDLQDELGKITGFVHGAGVLRDRLLVDKTAEQFSDVYDTKVRGFESVIEAIDVESLKALVLFSSSTGRYGRKGQVDYAVANEVMNKIAQKFSVDHLGCRVVSINWGPWDGGMVNISLKKMFESEGISVIPLQAGAQYLADELTQPVSGQAVEIVVMGPTPLSKVAPLKMANSPEKMTRVFGRSLNLTTHRILADHIIDGKPVLPSAVMIEWLAHAALHSNPGFVFHGFDDFKVTKGVILDHGMTIELSAWAGSSSKKHGQYIVSAELRSTAPGGRQFVRAKADIVLVELLPKAAKSTIDVDTGVYEGSIATAYEKHLFHGPDLQGIKSLNACSAKGLTGNVVCAPHPSEWMQNPMRGRWLTDPLVIDSAFQLMILWSIQQVDIGCLPMGVKSYRQYKNTFPQAGSEVRISIQSGSDKAMSVKSDIEFLDQRGRVVAQIFGYEGLRTKSLVTAFAKNKIMSPAVSL